MGRALAVSELPQWPAAMNRDLALAYTSVSEAQMRVWEREGRVQFRARGPNGAKVCLRAALDVALTEMFTRSTDEDLDFGDEE